jgi:hypothetical protein
MKFFDETDEGPAMLRVVAQAILLAAGIVAAFFVTRPNAAFPFYQLAVTLGAIALAAVAVGTLLWRRLRSN